MRNSNRSHLHALTPANAARRASRDHHAAAPRLRPQLVADGVVAGYIHDISTRHRDGDSRVARYDLSWGETYDLSLRETYDLTPEAEAA